MSTFQFCYYPGTAGHPYGDLCGNEYIRLYIITTFIINLQSPTILSGRVCSRGGCVYTSAAAWSDLAVSRTVRKGLNVNT